MRCVYLNKALLLLLLALALPAQAADTLDRVTINGEAIDFKDGYNLERCLEYDRLRNRVAPLDTQTCEGMRGYYARRKKAEEEARLQAEELRSQREEQRRIDEALAKLHAVEQRKLSDERNAQREASIARQEHERNDAEAAFKARQAAEKAEQERQEEAEARAERAEEKRRSARIAALKARCGGDYKNLRIGMPVERVQECISPVKLSSQINRADGVVSVYVFGDLWVTVMSGRVVAWGR